MNKVELTTHSQKAYRGECRFLHATAWEHSRLTSSYTNCFTCVHLAKISWGHMLGVRAEKGPLAEGMWLSTTRDTKDRRKIKKMQRQNSS